MIFLYLTAYPKGWTGPWTLDSGLWTLDSGLWTLDSGLWTSPAPPPPPHKKFSPPNKKFNYIGRQKLVIRLVEKSTQGLARVGE